MKWLPGTIVFAATVLLLLMCTGRSQEPRVTTVKVKTVQIDEVYRKWALELLKQAMTGQGTKSMTRWAQE